MQKDMVYTSHNRIE